MLRGVGLFLVLVAAALAVSSTALAVWGRTVVPSDPLFAYQWHLNNDSSTQSTPSWRTPNGVTDIDWLEAHQTYGAGAARVIVAVDDTGVQLDHPGLAQLLWTCPTDGNPCPSDGLPDSAGVSQCVPGEQQCTPGAHGVFDGAYCAGELYGGPNGNSYCMGGWSWGLNEADGAIYDKSGHGTNVAGIITGVDNGKGVTGICHNCEILVVKAINLQSLNYIIRNAAIEGKRVVINDSTPIPSWSEATHGPLFERVQSENVVYATSAGNGSSELYCDDIEQSSRPFCCLDSTLCVSAIVEDGALLSSYGDAVDVSGTGYIMTTRPCTEGLGYCTAEEVEAGLYGCEEEGGLYGAYPSHNADDEIDGAAVWWGDYDGNESAYSEGFEPCYNRFGGSSAASPVVAAVAAEILSHFPALSNDAVTALIKETATTHTIIDSSGRTYDDEDHSHAGKLGTGLVNLNNALGALYAGVPVPSLGATQLGTLAALLVGIGLTALAVRRRPH